MELLTPSCKTNPEVIQATEIMEQTMSQLKKQFWELIYAFNVLKLCAVENEVEMSTDWEYLYFHPKTILSHYRQNRYEELKYQLLHIILHGLMLDFVYEKDRSDESLAWAASDLRVDYLAILYGLCGKNQARTNAVWWFHNTWEKTDTFGNYIKLKKSPRKRKDLLSKAKTLACDDHRFWKLVSVEVQQNWEDAADKIFGGKKAGDKKKSATGEAQSNLERYKQLEQWENQKNKDSYGNQSGSFKRAVKASKQSNQSYIDFLSDFLQLNDIEKEKVDSIDAMLYSYGLDLYEDVPLIEPNECEEDEAIHNIAIAIDTSGSCQGELAERFLRETGNLIRDGKNFLKNGKIYLFTCDCAIQTEDAYDACDVTPDMFEEKELYGWGGTSFVPVFERMEEIQKKEGIEFELLLYMTDGMGEFPEKEANFPTYFAMTKEEQENLKSPEYWGDFLPNWIQILSLGEEVTKC